MNRPESHSITFRVPEMDCPQELGMIQRGLQDLDGVQDLEPAYLERTLRVRFDPQRVSAAKIEQKLVQIGFPPAPVAPQASSADGAFPTWRSWFLQPAQSVALIAWVAAIVAQLTGAPTALTWSLAGIAVLVAGSKVVVRAARSLRLRHLDMHVLITLAAAGALLIGEWLEAATVMVLFRLSLVIEEATQQRARRALHSLLDLTPEWAIRLVGTGTGETQEVAVASLQVADRVLVRPGQRIPADGVVREGQSSVNEAPITGESVPVDKQTGDEVFAGTLCGEAPLVVEITKPPQESTLARISRLIEQAREKPAQLERVVDRFARRYTPMVIAAALIVAFGPTLAQLATRGWHIHAIDWTLAEQWLFRGLVILVIACPCALVLSTPVTILSGLYRASRSGVLVKGGVFLEQLGSLRCVAFDKTGTLTEGQPRVVEVVACGPLERDTLLRTVAALEHHSEHPLARAIAEAADGPLPNVEQFEVLRGFGVQGIVNGQHLTVASPRYFQQQPFENDDAWQSLLGVRPDATIAVVAERTETHGDTQQDDTAPRYRCLGAIYLRDEPRPDAADTIARLRRLGIDRLLMLTGDQRPVAAAISQRVGLHEYYADLLPDDKIARVRQLTDEEQAVAMVGDGVNDAPALAAAPIGIALGALASDVALETADVAVLSPQISRLGDLIALSRRVRRILLQNIVLALGIKLAVLVATILGYGSMWLAVLSDVGASLLVIANGLRLLDRDRWRANDADSRGPKGPAAVKAPGGCATNDASCACSRSGADLAAYRITPQEPQPMNSNQARER